MLQVDSTTENNRQKSNFNFVFTFGLYFIIPETQNNVQRVFQSTNTIPVGNV